MTDRADDIVICHPVRTPVGRFGGVFKSLSATQLAVPVLQEALARAGIDGAQVDDVILGQCYPSGEAPAIGRVAALDAGLPTTVPGAQVDRRCGSGLQAVLDACMRVASGALDVVIAGGAESMSRVEFYTDAIRFGVRQPGVELHDRLVRARVRAGGEFHPVAGGMVETAENVRRQYGISREDQDAWSLRSHARAVAAADAGRFATEIVPVRVFDGGQEVLVDTDEHPRRDVTLESLARLKPVMARQDPDATVTAGNASGQNDGAAACLVMRRETADALGVQPMLRLVSWAVAAVEPRLMGMGPVPATERALQLAGLRLADLDLIEINEAFASQVLACLRVWKIDERTDERVNPNGSGISLGHAVGSTGARILATLSYELHRRDGRYALETMCIGGGQGLAAVFEKTGER